MNCLELRVDHGRLYERWQSFVVDRSAEVVEQARYLLWRRWDKIGAAWVVVVSSNPVLLRPNHTSDLLVRGVRHQSLVNRYNLWNSKVLGGCRVVYREDHGVDVPKDFPRRGARLASGRGLGFRRGELAHADLQSFHLGGRDRLGPQE